MTMQKALHPRDDVDGLCVKKRRNWTYQYRRKRGGRLITATRNTTDNMKNNCMEISHEKTWT